MADLSHWDFAEEFTGKETASLLRGLDPLEQSASDFDPTLLRLSAAYDGALTEILKLHERLALVSNAEERAEWIANLAPHLIHSKAMREQDDLFLVSSTDADLLFFSNQKFSRQELVRWLDALGLAEASRYRFDIVGAPPKTREPPTKAIDLAQTEKPPLCEVRAQRLVQIAIELGYPTPNLPPRMGRDPGPKAKILSESLKPKHKDLSFTKATGRAAWEFASKHGWLRDGGLAKGLG